MSVLNKRSAVAIGECACKDIKATPNGVDVCTSLDLERDRQLLFLHCQNNIVGARRWLLFDDDVDVIFVKDGS